MTIGALAFWMRSPDYPGLKAQGDTLVAAAERYRATHGRYPTSLEAAGVAAPKTRFGPWRYTYHPSTDVFDLEIGDYGRDGFTLRRRSGENWYLDT